MSNGYAEVSKDWEIKFVPNDLVNVLVERESFIEIMEANKAIARVRELHKQIDGIGVKVCAVCIDDNMYWTEQTKYPCPTIKALDGEK